MKQDQTLADYIKRTIEAQKREEVWNNRNVWNDPALAKQDVYYVQPEPKSIDSDEKINPYSQH